MAYTESIEGRSLGITYSYTDGLGNPKKTTKSYSEVTTTPADYTPENVGKASEAIAGLCKYPKIKTVVTEKNNFENV